MSRTHGRMRPPEKLERALSIRQPYAELILRGRKRAEYRRRPTHIRERVYVYAALGAGDADHGVRQGLSRADQERLPRGLIVGSVEIVGCRRTAPDELAWLLARPRRYRTPVRPGGQPMPVFWRPRWR